MSLDRDYGYSPFFSSPEPLPPESRKGWLVFLAVAVVVAFGITAFGVLSKGLDSFSQREYLNTVLELQSQMRGELLSIRRLQEEAPGTNLVKDRRQAFYAYRTNFLRFYDEFHRAVRTDSQNLPTLAGVDSAVRAFFIREESILQLDDGIKRAREQKVAAVRLSGLLELKKNNLDSSRLVFLAAQAGLQTIEENLQGRRKDSLDFQISLLKRLYLITATSLFFGVVMVWLLARVRSGQKRERAASEFLAQSLTEVKATEEALRQSNERFHLAASATSGVIYDWNIGTGRIVWTENITAGFGYAFEEVEPTYDWREKQIHPSDLGRIRAQLKENLTSGKDFIGEYRFRHKNGHYVDVWDKGRVVRDSSGRVVRMVGSMVDVSEQKRVEKALRAIAEGISSSTGVNFFRALVRHLASALGVKYALVGEMVDEKQERVRTVAVWSGEGYAENFEYGLAGTPCENVVGQSMCLYASGIQRQFPEDLVLKELGAESYLGTPLFDSAGKPLGLLAVLHHEPLADEFDLRSILGIFAVRAAAELERKKTEETLRESEERFRKTFSEGPIGMVIVGNDYKLLKVNRALCEMLGYTEEELARRTFMEITHPEDVDKDVRLAEKLFRGEIPSYRLEKRYLKKNGEILWIHLTATVVRDFSGNIQYGLGMVEDISERKRVLEELARARDAALEQANLKSQFLANMSHEIRTPMNGVLGYLGLLSSRAFADEREMTEFVRGAKSSAESLLTLINDILDFSKIEAGKLSIESIEFDLRSVVEDTASLLAPKTEQKGLELACLVEFGVPLALKGDPTRLRQVLINLTGNAVKFTEKGEIVIRASLLDENEQSARIRFSVKDTGIGIPADKHHLLFQSFTQVDGSSTRRFGGTGLGLAISKQLVELMGGTIGFQSEPGKGSEFWFEVALSKNLAARPRMVNADIRNAALLVVDDNGVNRDILCRMVESFGCRAFSAAGSAEAMRVLQKQLTLGDPIRTAIIDFQMPEEDGEKLAKKIKSHPALEPTFLILLTSVGTRGDAARAKQAGFAAYLHKPVKQSQLLEAITAVLGRSKQEEEEQPLITRHWLEEAKRGGSILLAEDNPVNQAVAEAVLSRAGYAVVSVKDGREAVEVLSARDFDLVLMDLQMPEMDGIEATREIRKMTGPKSKTPIIAMTAHALSGDREKCLKAGMNDYVSKPIEPLELKEVIQRWMARKPSPSANAAPGRKSGAAAPVDWARLEESSGGDEEFRRQLTEVFLADCEGRLSRLKESLTREDFGPIAREAHSIKGAAANFGATELSGLAGSLEKKAEEKNGGRCRELADKIIGEFERVKSFLAGRKVEKR